MSAERLPSVDIAGLPELLRAAEEVRATRTPRLLRCGDEDIALLVPVPKKRRAKRAPTEADYAAFHAAAGAWQGHRDDRNTAASPASSRRASARVSEADREAFLTSLGGWQGIVDVDQFLKDNEESRRISTRPPVDL